MSYCRFQNTLADLEACYDAMDDKLSRDELAARWALVRLCVLIASDYADDDGKPTVEKPER